MSRVRNLIFCRWSDARWTSWLKAGQKRSGARSLKKKSPWPQVEPVDSFPFRRARALASHLSTSKPAATAYSSIQIQKSQAHRWPDACFSLDNAAALILTHRVPPKTLSRRFGKTRARCLWYIVKLAEDYAGVHKIVPTGRWGLFVRRQIHSAIIRCVRFYRDWYMWILLVVDIVCGNQFRCNFAHLAKIWEVCFITAINLNG